jgi:hypothetical protein
MAKFKKMFVQDYVNAVCDVCGPWGRLKIKPPPTPKMALCGLTSMVFSSIVLAVGHWKKSTKDLHTLDV